MAPHDLKQIYMCLILPYIYYVHSGYKNDEFIALDLWKRGQGNIKLITIWHPYKFTAEENWKT